MEHVAAFPPSCTCLSLSRKPAAHSAQHTPVARTWPPKSAHELQPERESKEEYAAQPSMDALCQSGFVNTSLIASMRAGILRLALAPCYLPHKPSRQCCYDDMFRHIAARRIGL